MSWIKLDDKFPETGVVVLIVLGGFVTIGVLKNSGKWSICGRPPRKYDGSVSYNKKITHWMPLPQFKEDE